MRKILMLALLATSTTSAMAALTFGPGTGGSIPDGPAGNTQGSILTSDIVISGTGLTVSAFNNITIQGLTHTFAGDLLFTLTHMGTGTKVDVMDRAGRTGTGSGSSADFVGGIYKFVDSGGAAIPSSGTIATGTYNTVPNIAGGSSSANGALANFVGLSLDGTWRLEASDWWNADTGGFNGWTFEVEAVPEPGTMIALGAGLAALAARRRRKA